MSAKKFDIQPVVSAFGGFAYLMIISFLGIAGIGWIINYLFHPKYYIKFDFKGEKLIQYLDVMPSNFLYFGHEVLLLILYILTVLILVVYSIEYVLECFDRWKTDSMRDGYFLKEISELTHEEKKDILESTPISLFFLILIVFAVGCYASFFPWEGIVSYLPGFLSGLLKLLFFWPITLVIFILTREKIYKLVNKSNFDFQKIKKSLFILFWIFLIFSIATFFLQKREYPSHDIAKELGGATSISQENEGIKIVKKDETIFIPARVFVSDWHEISGEDAYGNEQSWTEEKKRYYLLDDFLGRYFQSDENSDKQNIKNYQDCLESMQNDYTAGGYADVYGCNDGSDQEATVHEFYHLLSAYIKYAAKYININSKYTGGVKYSMLGENIK